MLAGKSGNSVATPEMSQAHATACFCYPLEHTLSYLLENFGRTVGKLAFADATAVKKTKILLADFGLTWSANKTGVPLSMDLTCQGPEGHDWFPSD
ncbi:hypothetical protein DSO57_1001897 [Entomophthora muscae]|uniref:Uncharacterized protein n=1 Tax=Entomophthora muscae TaxID=34485 RepID=A0ACC2TK43_9FUNG|nr:hypothetical protein DSO57_1001897 [Entomophthora muscae]